MKSTPVLIQGWGARAILAGLKTQTRRARGLELINQNPDDWQLVALFMDGQARFYNRVTQQDVTIKCPYGGDWDEIWFREAHYTTPDKKELLGYVADGDIPHGVAYRVCPSIFMPKKDSRISRTIRWLRCERLQSITEADAIAEGVEYHPLAKPYIGTVPNWLIYYDIWNSINGKTLPVSRNCWVWIPEWENR